MFDKHQVGEIRDQLVEICSLAHDRNGANFFRNSDDASIVRYSLKRVYSDLRHEITDKKKGMRGVEFAVSESTEQRLDRDGMFLRREGYRLFIKDIETNRAEWVIVKSSLSENYLLFSCDNPVEVVSKSQSLDALISTRNMQTCG